MSTADAAGSLVSRWPAALMDTYGTPAIALVRGEGSTVWDEDGPMPIENRSRTLSAMQCS